VLYIVVCTQQSIPNLFHIGPVMQLPLLLVKSAI